MIIKTTIFNHVDYRHDGIYIPFIKQYRLWSRSQYQYTLHTLSSLIILFNFEVKNWTSNHLYTCNMWGRCKNHQNHQIYHWAWNYSHSEIAAKSHSTPIQTNFSKLNFSFFQESVRVLQEFLWIMHDRNTLFIYGWTSKSAATPWICNHLPIIFGNNW